MTSIVIPDSVTSIGGWAFHECSGLQFTVYENVKYLGNQNNPYHAAIEPKNDNLSSFVLHENTKIIASTTFSDCSRLSSIEIPDTVTSIGRAFSGCSNLRSITFKGTVAQWNAVEKHPNWNYNLPGTEVVCKDGKA